MRILGFFLGILMTTSCLKTEILNAPKPIVEQADTTKRVVRTEADTTRRDEPRVPMGFNPSVEDWEIITNGDTVRVEI